MWNFLITCETFFKSFIQIFINLKFQYSMPCCAVPYRAVPCRTVPCRAVPCLEYWNFKFLKMTWNFNETFEESLTSNQKVSQVSESFTKYENLNIKKNLKAIFINLVKTNILHQTKFNSALQLVYQQSVLTRGRGIHLAPTNNTNVRGTSG